MIVPYRLKDTAGVILYGNTACYDVRKTAGHTLDDFECRELVQKNDPKRANVLLKIIHGPQRGRI